MLLPIIAFVFLLIYYLGSFGLTLRDSDMASEIIIPRASDREVVDFFRAFVEKFPTLGFSVSISGKSGLDHKKDEKNISDIYNFDGFNVTLILCEKDGFKISFHRGTSKEPKSFVYDSIIISNGPSGHPSKILMSDSEIVWMNLLVGKFFQSKLQPASFAFSDPKAFEAVISSHQHIVAQLETSLATVGEKFAQARTELESKLSEERLRLERETTDHKERLDKDHERRLAEVAEVEKRLEQRAKELDDRDNTHVRRRIRSELKEKIAEYAKNFQLTGGTRGLRTPITLVVLVGLAALGFGIWYFGEQAVSVLSLSQAEDGAIRLMAFVKPVGFTVAFLGLLTWYLRWLNRWFERHAEAEFRLKQFELDMDRASWVVETALEWREQQKTAMPDHLLEGISRNLFSKSEKDEGADMHPADYLASALLGSASGVKLKLPGGGEVEYDKKGIKDLNK